MWKKLVVEKKCYVDNKSLDGDNEKGVLVRLREIVRAPRKAPSICYYSMKTLFEYKDKGMLFFFEILRAQ